MADYLSSRHIAQVLRDVLPAAAPSGLVAAFCELCELDHGAVLALSSTPAAITEFLRGQGMAPAEPIPSVVVQNRLIKRYRLPPDQLRMSIVHARIPRPSSVCGIEVFLADSPPPLPVIEGERHDRHETHIAVRFTGAGREGLERLWRLLATCPGGLKADGGGYNPAHGEAGCTVMYFRAPGRTPQNWPRRLEIIAAGRHDAILRHHQTCTQAWDAEDTGSPEAAAAAASPRTDHGDHDDENDENDDGETEDADDPQGRHLLRLLTGAWTTQALKTMAALSIADHLQAGPLTHTDLARRTGTDPDRLYRLLRFLAHPWIQVLTVTDGRFQLTDLGRRLARTSTGSMRNLAILYGDLFYRSFGALQEAVSEGSDPFEVVYGQRPFDYLASHPRQGEIFHQAMAEGSIFLAQIPKAVDLSHARSIADIGGGNGELIAHVLDAHPDLHAAILDRPEVIGAARAHLAQRGHAGGCHLIPGSFTSDADVPAGMDVYVLARVLHDSDNDQCRKILDAVRRAAPDDSTLLIVERLLPDDPGRASLASLWDLNMMVNNTGGRERTQEQYRQLLQDAGYLLLETRQLALDMSIMIACPAVADPSSTSSLPAGFMKYLR
ncbi:methyltransferase [Actinomadura rubrisoli]|uniref:Uncharacterized protein n=1 Tax=Actinomadura rubrisoli TaxID=2530368 RepID=A0A4R5AHF6_9ACTN|nr:methyltransferase [Actinomadura rubrisoli]TDD70836.1 hypothetical protein E1298_36370 [Actinomadura rubrisoli]